MEQKQAAADSDTTGHLPEHSSTGNPDCIDFYNLSGHA